MEVASPHVDLWLSCNASRMNSKPLGAPYVMLGCCVAWGWGDKVPPRVPELVSGQLNLQEHATSSISSSPNSNRIGIQFFLSDSSCEIRNRS